MKNKNLKKRIIEISYKHKLSHLGSCLTAVDIIDEIYQKKKPDEKFVLSSGHAGLALYCVIEKYSQKLIPNSGGGFIQTDAEDIFNHHGVHPDRCELCGLSVSTGSLGQGLPIAVGMALADRSKKVYCLISDGECSEGSIWEALRIQKELYLDNLHVYVNINSWGAYKEINSMQLANQLKYMSWATPKFTSIEQFPFLQGQDAHYKIMTDEDYKEALKIL